MLPYILSTVPQNVSKMPADKAEVLSQSIKKKKQDLIQKKRRSTLAIRRWNSMGWGKTNWGSLLG